MSDDLTDRLREVTGGKLDCTNTPNSLRLAAADRIDELEANLGEYNLLWQTYELYKVVAELKGQKDE